MAQLLYDWLNEQVTLTHKVNSFSEDFKDGYLLGNILYKYNQQLNFNEFSSKGNPSSKLNNFILLEPTMRKIGAHFNSKVVSEIMLGKENTVKNLLYEMKTLLEAIYRNSQQNSSIMMRGTSNDKALCVIAPTRPSYDKTKLATFSNAIHAQVESTNDVLMAKVLNKHTSNEKVYSETMSTADSHFYEELNDQRLHNRELERTRKAQATEFSQTWEAHNVEQWKTNLKVAHDRRNLKKKVDNDILYKKGTIEAKVKMNTRNNTFYNMNEFDGRLEANLLVAGPEEYSKEGTDSLIKTSSLGSRQKQTTLLYIDQNIQKKGLEMSQKKMKEHHEDIIIKQQAHDQRRRKFLREYDTMQIKMSQNIFATDVIAQLLNFSIIEEVESVNMNKVIKYKEIIPENRKNRQDLIDEIVTSEVEKADLWSKLLANREVDWNIGDSRVAHYHRSDVLLTSRKIAGLEITKNFCVEVIDKVLDVVEFVISCRTLGCFDYEIVNKDLNSNENSTVMIEPSSQLVPTEIWNDAAKMFVSSLPISERMISLKKVNASTALAPFAIVRRPSCAQEDVLFSKPFHSETLFTPCCRNVTNADISANLSEMDTKEYIASLHHSKEYSEEFMVTNPELSLPPSDTSDTVVIAEGEIDTLLTPQWIFNTAPCNILGEAIIATRCVVNQFPVEPSAIIPTNHIPFRIAISSVSDVARKALTTELNKLIPGLLVIEVNQLVQNAFEFYQNELLINNNTDEIVECMKEVSLKDNEISNIETKDSVESKEASYQVKYKLIAAKVYEHLTDGTILTDDIYISLIVNVIEQIPFRNNGFVLQDFPNTKHQLVQLMQSLSGIDYDSHRAQPVDYATEYASIKAKDELLYDISKCGLNSFVHIDNADGIYTSLNERILVRLNEKTGERMYITENQKSIEGLKVTDDSYKSILASGIDLTISELNTQELVKFTERIKLLDLVTILDKDKSVSANVLHLKAFELVKKFMQEENLLPGYILPSDEGSTNNEASYTTLQEQIETNLSEDLQVSCSLEEIIVKEAIAAQVEALHEITNEEDKTIVKNDTESPVDIIESEGNVTTDKEIINEEPKEKYIYEMPSVIKQENFIPEPLAKALVTLWNTCENQSNRKSYSFFNCFRNIRYQMIQRRRAAYDCVTYFLIRFDNRQLIYDEFAKKFNSFEKDFRFDPDCISELHLLKLELVENLIKLSEIRKKEGEEYCNKIVNDSVISLLIHRSKCEAISILQSEFQRFFVVLHILFDFMKSTKGYNMNTRIFNELETTLSVTLPSIDIDSKAKSIKEKDPKKGKDVKPGPIPFREPIAPVIIPLNSMQLIPEVNISEENPDPKAKGKAPPKDKKGMVSTDTDLFTNIENQIIEEVKKWCKDTFLVNREVYDGDNELCNVLEKTIWYEADKLLYSIQIIKTKLSEQIEWLEKVEKQISLILNDMVIKKYHKELVAVNYLSSLIEKNIENAKDIDMIWLVTPEAKPTKPKKLWKLLFHTLPLFMRKLNDNEENDNDNNFDDSCSLKQSNNKKNAAQMSSKGLEIIKSVKSINVLDEVPSFVASGHFNKSTGNGKFASVGSTDNQTFQNSLQSNDSYASILSNESHSSINSQGIVNNNNDMNKSNSSYDLTNSRPSSASSIDNKRLTINNNKNNNNNRKLSFAQTQNKDAIPKEELERRKQQAIYIAKRLEFQDNLEKRVLNREKEFRAMGMTAAVAKLASFNDLHLQNEQELDDFDFINKPKIRKSKNKLK